MEKKSLRGMFVFTDKSESLSERPFISHRYEADLCTNAGIKPTNTFLFSSKGAGNIFSVCNGILDFKKKKK